MATYPNLPIDQKDSERVLRDSRQEDTAGDGTARVRKLAADKYDFKLKHPMLNATDQATLEAFYAAHINDQFQFVWPIDGATYNVVFGPGAKKDQWFSATRRHYWIVLAGQ
jgi:hypothetical protein